MNSAMSAQRSNFTFFFASVAITAVLLGVSGFFLKSLIAGGSNKNLVVAQKQCIATLSSNGYMPDTSKKGEIKVNRARIEQVESLVYQSSVLIASCPAYTLTDYCAGAACPNPGVSFTLKQKEL